VSTGPFATSVFAPAKINLFLHVGARRPDGYHDLCSLAAFADVGDRLTAEPDDSLSLTVAGPFAAELAGGDDDNLVAHAALALRAWARGKGLQCNDMRLRLEKNLPVASGVGGGSSDAAATLKLLDQVWQLNARRSDLQAIAVKLGADVPACLIAAATLMQGIGERLTPWPALPPLPVVLVNPGISLMTADVFRALKMHSGTDAPAPVAFKSPREVADWLRVLRNDLEEPARRIAPVVGNVLSEISATSGCLLARMSGSGATCFGLYQSDAAASAAASALRASRPDWWIVPTKPT
jgi:4-diphosphocytidyl-2-C-methyl-D-erythritol kinase